MSLHDIVMENLQYLLASFTSVLRQVSSLKVNGNYSKFAAYN